MSEATGIFGYKSKYQFLSVTLAVIFVCFGCLILLHYDGKIPWFIETIYLLLALTLYDRIIVELGLLMPKMPKLSNLFMIILMQIGGKLFFELYKFGALKGMHWALENWLAILAIVYFPAISLLWRYFGGKKQQIVIKE